MLTCPINGQNFQVRKLLLRQDGRFAGYDDAAWNVEPEQRDRGRHQGAQCEGVEPAGEAAGQILAQPTNVGPKNPPRLPSELIHAMPAAAAPPVRNIVGIDQNGPLVP
jgi:hypothetical protein